MAAAAAASFSCQFCNAKLTVAGSGADYDRPGTSASVFGDVSRIEESFIVLEDKKQGESGQRDLKGFSASPNQRCLRCAPDQLLQVEPVVQLARAWRSRS